MPRPGRRERAVRTRLSCIAFPALALTSFLAPFHSLVPAAPSSAFASSPVTPSVVPSPRPWCRRSGGHGGTQRQVAVEFPSNLPPSGLSTRTVIATSPT